MTTTATREELQSATASSPAVVTRLGVDAASAFDLYSQIKQAHWTVVGENFIALHELFDRQAAAIRGHIDELAERSRALGGVPHGTVRQSAELSELPELAAQVLPANEAVTELATHYRMLADRMRESAHEAGDAGDLATQDVYVDILRDLDMQEWFLRSHLA